MRSLLAFGGWLLFASNLYFISQAADPVPAGPPRIFGFSPDSGTPGTRVTISGTNLIGVTTVLFSGVDASFSSFDSGTNGIAIVPTNVVSGPITVYAAEGKTTSTNHFTVIRGQPPIIVSFTPSQGEPGTSVQIKGTNLATATSVQFNGVEATFSPLADLLLATAPINARTGPITVKTPDGTNTTTEVFTVAATPPPTVTSFSPVQGDVGMSVEIQGANLTSVTSVKFNGVEASFNILAGVLRAVVPATATSGPITVATRGGTHSPSMIFTVVQAAPPVVTGFVPNRGEPGSSVEIKGSYLDRVTAVRFNGANASFLAVGGTLRATVPFNATSGPITAVTAAGTHTSTEIFTVTAGPPPVITSLTPDSSAPGAIVEIRGQFLRDVTAVTFNGVEAVFTNALFRPLTAVVPAHAISGPVTVTTPTGTVTSTNDFTVVNPMAPVIDSFSPQSASPGTLIELLGKNLRDVVSVTFHRTPASFLEFSATRMFAFVPTNAVTGPITVITQSGAGRTRDPFTIGTPPSTTPPPLSLRIDQQGLLEVSWPADATGFVLQSSDSLSVNTSWKDETAQPRTSDGRLFFSKRAEANQKFFRLIRR